MNIQEIMEREEKLKQIMAITDANNLVTEMQHEVAKYTKLLELAKIDQVNTVKQNVNYYPYIYRIKLAGEWFSNTTQKMDKRSAEYKQIKTSFEGLENFLSNEVFKQPIKIIKFYHGGYEGYYEEVVFNISSSKQNFMFTVPNTEVLNTKNFDYACDGKLAFGVEEGIHLNILKTSYNIEDITKAFNEYISEGERNGTV